MESSADTELILKAGENDYSPEIAAAIDRLWKTGKAKEIWMQNRSDPKFWTIDEAPYFFENALRIATEEFQITGADMLRSRTKTTGVQEIQFHEGEFFFRVIDVGGQRSERRKWIQCFEDVDVVCFISSLVGYTSVLYEDENENRLNESLLVFEQIVGQPCFKTTPVFVWFTKIDLFKELLALSDISTRFSDYTGKAGDVAAALTWHRKKFSAVMADKYPNKALRFGEINALSEDSVAASFEDMKMYC